MSDYYGVEEARADWERANLGWWQRLETPEEETKINKGGEENEQEISNNNS